MTHGSDPSAIPAAGAHAQDGAGAERLMGDLLPAAQALALAPISGFRVGAVAHGLSGTLYLGANLEFPGAPLSASVHAEQAAVANAWHHGETGLAALAVTAMPCGHCRQFLSELAGADRLRIVIPGAPPAALAELLPSAFGPGDLGVHGGLMQPRADVPALGEASVPSLDQPPAGSPPELLRRSADGPPAPVDATIAAALGAAASSYAPYGGTYAGVALVLADGSTHVGRYAENAAFNPSLPPLQAALVLLAMRSIPFGDIRRAVLVETSGPVSQRGATEALLSVVAPGVPLTYVRAAVPGDGCHVRGV